MASFCEQYCYSSLVPPSKQKKRFQPFSRKLKYSSCKYYRKKRASYKPDKPSPSFKPSSCDKHCKPSSKTKAICWKCGKPGHFASKCFVKK